MGLFKKKQKGENNYDTENGYQNKGQRPNMDGPEGKARSAVSKLVILLVVLAVAAMDSFYTLSENEMAVVTTFGVPIQRHDLWSEVQISLYPEGTQDVKGDQGNAHWL